MATGLLREMMTMLYSHQILLFLTLSSLTVMASNDCLPSEDCSSCLLQGSHCSWCYQMDYVSTQRCNTLENHIKRKCSAAKIINPNSQISFTKNEPVRNADEETGLDAIQISPQKLRIQLVPGRPVKVPIRFRIAEDYPVDLYYIMDLSYSMLDDQDNLIGLGELMAKELRSITKDVRLGFGAFVDKALMPFAGIRPESVANPCFPQAKCEPTYGFRNQLSLTSNISMFGQRVRETPISGNQDGTEGGLDALVQAMACDQEIGWRPGSRKIILFSTDAKSHISGDAKLAGVLEPNDGHCHLFSNEYTYSLRQDYPSIGQIASIARHTSTSIIFAVSNFVDEYHRISDLIPSSVVGALASDSSNIVTLVKQKYDSLIKTVRLITSGLSPDDGIKVNLTSKCASSDSIKEGNICHSVGIGQQIEFEAEISMTSCTKSETKLFSIKPHDLTDSIEIEVDVQCECPCNDEEFQSLRCSGEGNYKCGICHCNQGFSGDLCQCDIKTVKTSEACLNPISNTTCSGLGECDNCGLCQCSCLPGEVEPGCSRYTGTFCECNTKSCDQRNGLICAGHGKCVCDENSSTSYCQCDPGYLGDDCGCPVSNQNCRAQNQTGEVCNGKGECSCGQCKCTDACYEGQRCEILKPECSRQCIHFRDCVICKVRPHEGIECDDASFCDSYIVKFVDEMKTSDGCLYTDKSNCRHFYQYVYNHANETWTIHILSTPQCLKDYWLEIIIGLCVGVLILGLLALIIWKIIVTVHDKREYAKFEKEALNAQWNSQSNPLYQPATSTFRNPMYSGAASNQPKAT